MSTFVWETNFQAYGSNLELENMVCIKECFETQVSWTWIPVQSYHEGRCSIGTKNKSTPKLSDRMGKSTNLDTRSSLYGSSPKYEENVVMII